MKTILTMLTVSVMAMFLITVEEAAAEDEKTFSIESLTENVVISGLVEVEAGISKDFDDVDTSSAELATVELGVDASVTDWCSGHILFSWEEGVDVDEGFITLGGTDAVPVYLNAGLIYVPFGVYETHMISDPLTLEIGETRENALQVGGEYKGLYGSLFLFNGDIQEESNDSDDAMETYSANAGYAFEKDNFSMDLGVDFISNILDSNGLGDGFLEAQEEFVSLNPNGSYELKKYVAGLGAHIVMNLGPACLVGEYIGSLDDIEYNTDDGAGTTAAIKTDGPTAFHVEGAYTIEAMEKEITLAATYQATDNLAGVLPETRIGASAGIALTDGLDLTVEYLHDEDYDVADGGTGESGEAVTFQLALEF